MDNQVLIRPYLTVTADESDLFRMVQGQVVVVPQSMDPRWLEGHVRSTQRKIEQVEEYVHGRRGIRFGVESYDTESPAILAELHETKKHLEMASRGFPKRLFPSFLSWTRADSLPVFMVLSWDSPEFTLTARTSRVDGDSFTTNPVLPVIVAEQFGAMVDGLLSNHRGKNDITTVTISAVYSGQIPLATKAKMVEAQRSGLFSGFFIAAEAPKWEINQKVVARTDPIVFGVTSENGKTPEMMFMIDIFDPTPLETAAYEQYALSSKK